jgi:hypothetical protein
VIGTLGGKEEERFDLGLARGRDTVKEGVIVSAGLAFYKTWRGKASDIGPTYFQFNLALLHI